MCTFRTSCCSARLSRTWENKEEREEGGGGGSALGVQAVRPGSLAGGGC